MKNRTIILMLVVVASIAGCAGISSSVGNSASEVQSQIDTRSNGTKPFQPPWPSTEYKNYDRAQKLYASPTTIIWCTAFAPASTSPVITIPVAGKLTSSSVSFFPSTRVKLHQWSSGGKEEYTPERRSLDGMYHGSPPPYRYGFTPGGQYVDFFNLPTLCTTKPMSFQRKSIEVGVDNSLAGADGQAEAALKAGDPAAAQDILNKAVAGS